MSSFMIELKENISKMGANIKRNLINSVQNTITAIQDFARAHTGNQRSDQLHAIEHESEMKQTPDFIDTKAIDGI